MKAAIASCIVGLGLVGLGYWLGTPGQADPHIEVLDTADHSSPIGTWRPLGDDLPKPPVVSQNLYNCMWIGGSGNNPAAFDTSARYMCDGGIIEIHGQWDYVVEYGEIYTNEFGVPQGAPRRATLWDRDSFTWCRDGDRQVITCGWRTRETPKKDWDKPWNPNPQDFPPGRHSGERQVRGDITP